MPSISNEFNLSPPAYARCAADCFDRAAVYSSLLHTSQHRTPERIKSHYVRDTRHQTLNTLTQSVRLLLLLLHQHCAGIALYPANSNHPFKPTTIVRDDSLFRGTFQTPDALTFDCDYQFAFRFRLSHSNFSYRSHRITFRCFI